LAPPAGLEPATS